MKTKWVTVSMEITFKALKIGSNVHSDLKATNTTISTFWCQNGRNNILLQPSINWFNRKSLLLTFNYPFSKLFSTPFPRWRYLRYVVFMPLHSMASFFPIDSAFLSVIFTWFFLLYIQNSYTLLTPNVCTLKEASLWIGCYPVKVRSLGQNINLLCH